MIIKQLIRIKFPEKKKEPKHNYKLKEHMINKIKIAY